MYEWLIKAFDYIKTAITILKKNTMLEKVVEDAEKEDEKQKKESDKVKDKKGEIHMT